VGGREGRGGQWMAARGGALGGVRGALGGGGGGWGRARSPRRCGLWSGGVGGLVDPTGGLFVKAGTGRHTKVFFHVLRGRGARGEATTNDASRGLLGKRRLGANRFDSSHTPPVIALKSFERGKNKEHVFRQQPFRPIRPRPNGSIWCRGVIIRLSAPRMFAHVVSP